MKNFFYFLIVTAFISCKNESNRWEIKTSDQSIKVNLIDISEDIYESSKPMDSLRSLYPFFFDENVNNETYERQRKDSLERMVYADIKKTIDKKKLEEELVRLFQHVKYYYPDFTTPTVYLCSSVFGDAFKYEPVQYVPEINTFIIALDFFLGQESDYYKVFKVESYLRKEMNPENIVPRTSFALAETLPLMDVGNPQFLNYLVTYGKMYLLQDAFLPDYSDALKIGYTPKQIDWCYSNEVNMWSYFIQQDYLYSDDKDLNRRFLQPAPFSKFYIMNESNESVDIESPGGVGRWIGWQILRHYTQENPDKKLVEIMADRNFVEIFNQSQYQPK